MRSTRNKKAPPQTQWGGALPRRRLEDGLRRASRGLLLLGRVKQRNKIHLAIAALNQLVGKLHRRSAITARELIEVINSRTSRFGNLFCLISAVL